MAIKYRFVKMHGLGNDFIVLDAIRQSIDFTKINLPQLADRRFGVGCDQILVVEKSFEAAVDFNYRIFNADGSEVEQCGNGARCFARFVLDEGLTQKRDLVVSTKSGLIRLFVENNGEIRVNMGLPRFQLAEIPFLAPAFSTHYVIDVCEKDVTIGVVSMGNPHAVLRVESVEDAPVAHWGKILERHPRFPNRVNVGFMEVVDLHHIKLRVFERGAGETWACGTGACAAAVIGRRWGLLGDEVNVSLTGGDLLIRWENQEDAPVWMIGTATRVFEGSFDI
ncbi:MAG: diaminopimelate epimerase [Pseudomonadota bacterium]